MREAEGVSLTSLPASGSDRGRGPLAALAKPNAATVAMKRVQGAFEARDWTAIRALCAADMKAEDRRRRAVVSGGAERWIEDMQAIARARPNARFERQLLFTAGDRLDLQRILVTGEIEHLWLTEIDEHRDITTVITFDADDWRAAMAAGVARALAVDATTATLRPVYEFFLGFNDHDPTRVRAAFADDLVVDDRRLAGQGLVEGADAYIESLAALWRLAPEHRDQRGVRARARALRCCARHRGRRDASRRGRLRAPDGERVDRRRRPHHADRALRDEDADAALARFEELCANRA